MLYGVTLPSFYIFRCERPRDDYIKLYNPGTCITMLKKKDDYFLV
jgi:hypothetical protein